MMIRNTSLIVFTSIFFAGCASDNTCRYSGETAQVIPGEIFINLPSGWQLSDSSFIKSPGLVDAKTYTPSDNSGFISIDYYDMSNSDTSVNHDLLLMKQKSMLRGFLKGQKTKIIQKEKIIGNYKITIIQGFFLDTNIQKQIVLCLGLVDWRGKYSELIIRKKEEQYKKGLQEINCIMESLTGNIAK